MVSRTTQMCLALLTVMSVLSAIPVWANGWPLPEGSDVVLGFAESYERADGSVTSHGGLDIAGNTGDPVACVAAGTVTFAGSVPAASGGTLLAVTVQTSAGEKWSYLPLSELWLEKGDTVHEGVQLGLLADAGDPSSATTHLHVSLRRNERYIDPLPFMAAPMLVPEPAQPDPAVEVDVVSSFAPEVASPVLPAQTVAIEPQGEVVVASPVCVTVPAEVGIGAACEDGADMGVATEAAVSPMPTTAISGVTWLHDPDVRYAGDVRPSGCGATVSGVEVIEKSVAADPAPPLLSLRFLVAFAGLVPVSISVVRRMVRSRVIASGETVAAAVGR